MRHRLVGLLLGFVTTAGLFGCMDDSHHGGGTNAPAAPTQLTAAVLSGGAHLTWKDNATNEPQYMIERKEMGGASFTTIATPTFDTTQYHDGSLTAGKTYVYRVMAMNDDGHSDPSNEATIAIP